MSAAVILSPRATRPERRVCMSRRSGQQGSIERRGNTYYARFWLDEPGKARTHKRVRICPVDGRGSLNQSQRKRRLQQIVAEHGANDEATARAAEAANLGTAFKEQADIWIDEIQKRKRRPIKERTVAAWRSYLKYLNATIGDMPLADINNRTMKTFVTTMDEETTTAGGRRFSPKSIESYLQIVKMVVAWEKNDKGEPVYSVKWDSDFMDLPEIEEQNQPSFTAAEIETIISKAEGQERLLYALLAGSGLRIGEAFALRVEDIKDTVIRVRQSAWEGTLCDWTKTKAGRREVDIHSSLADALTTHLGTRTEGLVFPSERGTPLRKSNLLRRSLHPILKEMGRAPCGFHAFRRFRAAHLDKELVPEILVHIWMGHSNKDISQRYARNGVKIDSLFRTITAQKAGLGFNLWQEDRELYPVVPSEQTVSV
jgi:integrase